jgi:ketosteroid isomerase-like protein
MLLCAVAVAAAACQRPTTEMTESDRDAIAGQVREAVDAYFAAQNSNDAEEVFQTYLHSEDFAYLGVNDVFVGWEGFSAMVTNWFRNRPDIKFEHQTQLIQVMSPSVAVATVRASSTEQEFLLFTQVYVKNDAGRWVVAHEHVSWPEAPAPRRHPGMEEMAPPPGETEP